MEGERRKQDERKKLIFETGGGKNPALPPSGGRGSGSSFGKNTRLTPVLSESRVRSYTPVGKNSERHLRGGRTENGP